MFLFTLRRKAILARARFIVRHISLSKTDIFDKLVTIIKMYGTQKSIDLSVWSSNYWVLIYNNKHVKYSRVLSCIELCYKQITSTFLCSLQVSLDLHTYCLNKHTISDRCCVYLLIYVYAKEPCLSLRLILSHQEYMKHVYGT